MLMDYTKPLTIVNVVHNMQQSTAVIILYIYTFGVVYKIYKCMCFMIKLGRHLRYIRDTETCFELVFPHFVNFVFLLY